MSGEIRIGIESESQPEKEARPRVIPMKVGNATVYVEQIGPSVKVKTEEGQVQLVAPSPEDVFNQASEALQECVRVLGERIKNLRSEISPSEVTVEFALSFEAGGKASLIPIFVTGESKVSTGLKVTAHWKCRDGGES